MADDQQPLDLSIANFSHHAPTESETEIYRSPDEQHHIQKQGVSGSRVQGGYRPYAKPPYPYMGMIAVAIHNSPQKRLVLGEIYEAICEMFAFFREEYQGWRTSVRNTLSRKKCFFAIKRSSTTTKGCYWCVDLSLLPPNALYRIPLRDVEQRRQWAPTLTRQLGIPDIDLSSVNVPKLYQSQKQTTRQIDRQHKQQNTVRSPMNSINSSPKPFPTSSSQDKLDNPNSSRNVTVYQPHEDQTVPVPNMFLYVYIHHPHRPPEESSVQSEQHLPPYAAMLYRSIASHTTPVESSLCPPPSYDETRPLSTLSSMSHTFHEVDHDYLPVEAQPVFRLRLDDWNMQSM